MFYAQREQNGWFFGLKLGDRPWQGQVFRIRLERNPFGPGWWLDIQLGNGAGYIHGWSAFVARNVKRHYHAPFRSKWALGLPTSNGNRDVFPGWW